MLRKLPLLVVLKADGNTNLCSTSITSGGSPGSVYLPRLNRYMPSVGLGTGQEWNCFDGTTCVDSVKWLGLDGSTRHGALGLYFEDALRAGVRLFDTAWMYGSEAALGTAMHTMADELGLRRSDVFIIAKPPATFEQCAALAASVPAENRGNATENELYYLSSEELRRLGLGLFEQRCAPVDIEGEFERQLSRLRTDYVDIFLVHHPGSEPGSYLKQYWRTMEGLVDQGKILGLGMRADGLKRRMADAGACIDCDFWRDMKHPPVMLWGDIDETDTEFVSTLRDAGVVVGRGGIGSGAIDQVNVLERSFVQMIADKYNKTFQQVVLRYSMQNSTLGSLSPVMPQSWNMAHIRENLDVGSFALTAEEVKLLRGIAFDW